MASMNKVFISVGGEGRGAERLAAGAWLLHEFFAVDFTAGVSGECQEEKPQ